MLRKMDKFLIHRVVTFQARKRNELCWEGVCGGVKMAVSVCLCANVLEEPLDGFWRVIAHSIVNVREVKRLLNCRYRFFRKCVGDAPASITRCNLTLPYGQRVITSTVTRYGFEASWEQHVTLTLKRVARRVASHRDTLLKQVLLAKTR